MKMRTKRTSGIIILLFLMGWISRAQNTDHAQMLDQFIINGMADWQIPGLSAVVVKDGEIAFQGSYGLRNIAKNEKVDNQTLFAMASTTKAFIAISIAMLVDEGKIKWDDKVIDHLPVFQLSDPHITASARVKDLLTHNLGLGNADALWTLDSISERETIMKLVHAPVAYPIRGSYTYQNIMYVAAGEVIKEVSGIDWRTFVESRILKPLGMTRTYTISSDVLSAGNYTEPYYNDFDEGVIRVPFTFSDQIGAAGMMWSCTDDMAKYITFLDNGGIVGSDTLLKKTTFKYLFQPQALIPENYFYPTHKLTNPNWTSYGLGWFQHDYKGHKLDFHTGSLNGLVAITGIIHEKNTTVYVFSNLDHAELRHAIMYKAMDLFAFDENNRDWHKEVFKLYQDNKEQQKKAIQKRDEGRIEGTNPSLSLSEFEGKYEHKMYGKVVISANDQGLFFNINDLRQAHFNHWHHNTFISNKTDRWRSRFLVHFNVGQNGKISDLNFNGIIFSKK